MHVHEGDAGFPSNDFGAQEPGSNKEIAKFCEANYGVSFPMFGKTGVAKAPVNPFHAQLAKASGSTPKWNFHKYLVDRKGEKVLAYESAVAPDDAKLVAEIERLSFVLSRTPIAIAKSRKDRPLAIVRRRRIGAHEAGRE